LETSLVVKKDFVADAQLGKLRLPGGALRS
jgi:hypothetical protein